MKRKLLLLLFVFIGYYSSAQIPVLNLSIADANMLPSMKPSGAHYKVDRVYGQNLQTEYYYKEGTPTSALSPFLESLHLNIISTWVDPVSGITPVGYWTSEKVYSALINTIDFSKSMTHLVTAADIFKSDSTRIAADSSRLEAHKFTVTSALNTKQSILVSGTNIKTIGGTSILGSGNISFPIADSTLFRTTANSLSLSQAQSKLNTKQNLVSLTTTGSGSATFNQSTGALNIPTPIIPAQFNPAAGTGISITGTYPNQTFTNSSPDQIVSITPAGGLAVSGTYPNFTITQYVPTINSGVSRSFNSNFTISTTKQATVNYSISLSVTNPLLVGSSVAAAYLEYSTNAGSTWITLSDALINSSVGVTVTVAITNTQTQILSGTIPANALVRIRTTNTGTASSVYVIGQETY